MYFDYLMQDNFGRATIYMIHQGSYLDSGRMNQIKNDLSEMNIKSVKIVNSLSSHGSYITQMIGRFDRPSIVIVRQNLQTAFSWAGHNLPTCSDIAFRYNQIGH